MLCERCSKFIFKSRMKAHKQACKGELNTGKRPYSKRAYKLRGAYKKSKQEEKQVVEDSSEEDLKEVEQN